MKKLMIILLSFLYIQTVFATNFSHTGVVKKLYFSPTTSNPEIGVLHFQLEPVIIKHISQQSTTETVAA